VPGHFTTLRKSWSTSTPSGQLAREAAWYYSKTCLKRNLTGPENFSAKASFCLIKVHCLKRNLKGPEHFSAKARLNWTEEKNKVFIAMMTTAKLSLCHRYMICAAIQVLLSRDTLALINQNKQSIHDPIQSGHSWKVKQLYSTKVSKGWFTWGQ
jgi:hypothetical protein